MSLNLVMSLTDKSEDLCEAVCQIPEYLGYLKGIMDNTELNDDGTSDEDKMYLHRVIGVVNNLAMDDNNIDVLRDEDFQTSLTKHISADDDGISLAALLGLAAIMSEDENTNIQACTSTINSLMDEFEKSLESDMHRSPNGWKSLELASGILNLARFDDNKALFVEKNCLPNMMKIAISKNPKEREIALRCLWTLAFDDDVKKKLVEEPGLIHFLDEKRQSSDGENSDEKITCHNILWTLGDTFRVSEVHESIRGEMTENDDDEDHHDDGDDKGEGDVNAEYFKNHRSEEQENQQTQQHKNKPEKLRHSKEHNGHVMISYNWDKQDLVLKIRDQLKSNNIKVWMDVDDMEGSTLEAMAEAVEQAEIVIMCMSRKYKNSENCRAEAEYAFTKKRTIIPIRMETDYTPDGWLGIVCGSKLWYDFSDEQLMNSNMGRFLKAVENSLMQK
ncbi:uncharacterized protein LOC130010412 isoform X2 [Patella vulgata]|nr:uncharacterized protein LOC130010412 isoform X2 [Patella vulgata]